MARPKKTPINLTIDGREVAADEGMMLVDAAKLGDIEIPVFCYEPKLGEPVGACRMCLVEIEGIPKLQTACSTPVRDGMVVHTQTDQVKEAQNAIVEFLLVNHPLDCPVCDKGGECPLQDISMGWGNDRSRVVDVKRHFEKPTPLSPLIAIDRERCILCYRCVRFSQEVSEDQQLQLLERGDRSFVGTFNEQPYIAPFQGNITELCPVGALTSYTYRFQARPWDIEQGGSVCTLCPSQCNVSFTIRDEEVQRVLARDNEAIDDGWLCDRGRYGYQMMYSKDRVLNPIRFEDGNPVQASWAEAIQLAASGLAAAGGRTAALVGDASNEEGFILQRMIREGLGSKDIDSRQAANIEAGTQVRLYDPAVSALVADIDTADVVLVLGTDPIHSAPAFDLRVRKAVRRNGTKLVVATDRPSALDGGATEADRYAPGAAAEYVAGLAADVKSGSEEGIAGVLKGAADVVIVWGERLGRGAAGPDAVESLLELSESLGLAGKPESGLIEIPDAANARGLREVGCLPDAGPGFSQVEAGRNVDEIREGIESGEITSLVLYGVDPLRDFPDTNAWRNALEKVDHIVAFSMAATDTTDMATVVFPLESHAEKDGTVTHTEGRLQRVRPSAKRPGEIRPGWMVLAELSAAIGHETGIHSGPEALKAITNAVPFYAGLTDAEIGGRGVRWQDRAEAAAFSGLVDGASRPEPSSRRGRDVPSGDLTQSDDSTIGDTLTLGTFRDLWANPVTEMSPSLNYLIPAQRLEVSVGDAKRLGLSRGDEVAVKSGDKEVVARVAIRGAMPEGTCFLIEGTNQGNANVFANGKPAQVEIGAPSAKLDLVMAGSESTETATEQ
ncbi:MAG: NADH-quinone oxidoreductase subunit NuoG [Solirubrobacterales bacterium]